MIYALSIIAGYYVMLSALSLAMYGYDKHLAKTRRWRVRESTLHTIDLLGGWPGGWLGRRWLRHKTMKPAFRRMLALAVLLHVGLWSLGVWMIWRFDR